MRRTAVFLLLAIGLCGQAYAQSSDTCRRPRIFDGTLYRAKPNFAQYGIEPTYVFGVRWWNPGTPQDDLPPKRNVTKWMREARIQEMSARHQLLIPDLEHWPFLGERAAVERSVNGFVTLIRWMREDYRGPIGFYGIPPIRDYWRAVKGPDSPEYRAWQAQNDLWTPLARESDAIFPSLYTFYDDMAGWETYAIANLREARRVSGGKPVYAFLCPTYHDSNRKLAGQFLPFAMWKRQLEIVTSHADGAVIWGGWQAKPPGPAWWDERAEWWQATKEFVSAQRPCPPADLKTIPRAGAR
jgi:hypothetical protein